MEPINPMINDLLTPARTLIGSYGRQTAVNDQRLRNFLYSLYKDTLHYTNIDLYWKKTSVKFSMNWVISFYQRNFMRDFYSSNPAYKKEQDKMEKWAKPDTLNDPR
jgi:hypothetical protein